MYLVSTSNILLTNGTIIVISATPRAETILMHNVDDGTIFLRVNESENNQVVFWSVPSAKCQ